MATLPTTIQLFDTDGNQGSRRNLKHPRNAGSDGDSGSMSTRNHAAAECLEPQDPREPAAQHHTASLDQAPYREAIEDLRKENDIPASDTLLEKSEEIGVLASSVQRERLRWLWPGRLALGKITILDGDPGVGKSTLHCDLAARITTGKTFPFTSDQDTLCEAGGVVIVTCEDGIRDTIVPRLEEAGADLARCLILQTVPEYDPKRQQRIETTLAIPDHLSFVERAIRRVNARLLIIDPLMAHLSAGVNSFRDQDVRRAMAPLAQMAERLGTAVLLPRHLNKMKGGQALYRGGGSIGIIGIARLGLLLGRSPDSEDTLILTTTKANIARESESLALRVVSSERDRDVGMIEWVGPSPLTSADLLQESPKKRGRPPERRTAAKHWLAERLADGQPHAAKVLSEEVEKEGFSKNTVNRASTELGVHKQQVPLGPGGAWYWSLPEAQNTRYPNTGHLGKGEASKAPVQSPESAMSADFARCPKNAQTTINHCEGQKKIAGSKVVADVKTLEPGMRVHTPDGPGIFEQLLSPRLCTVWLGSAELELFQPNELEVTR